jgi:hypothetical protein
VFLGGCSFQDSDPARPARCTAEHSLKLSVRYVTSNFFSVCPQIVSLFLLAKAQAFPRSQSTDSTHSALGPARSPAVLLVHCTLMLLFLALVVTASQILLLTLGLRLGTLRQAP